MKKKFGVVLVVVVLVLSGAQLAEAGAYKSCGIGTRALAMGGGIAAANDYSALYWNPAALTEVEKNHFAIEPHYLYLTQSDGNSVKNYDLGVNYSNLQGDAFLRIYNVPGARVEPAQFNKTDSIYSNISPSTSLGGAFAANDFNLAFGIYTPAALSTKWEDAVRDLANNALIEADYLSSIKITNYNLSVGKEVNSWFSLGAGINYVTGETEIEIEKRYRCSAAPVLDYTYETSEEADGDGVEGVLGVLVKPIENLKVGGVYRNGAGINLIGDAYYKHTALGILESSGYSQDYYFPNSYGLGLAYDPISNLTLLLDWEQTGWHKVKRELDYNLVGGAALADTDIDWNWEDSNQVRLGGEYRFTPAISLRGCMMWDESPLSDDTVSITNVIDVDKWHTYLGIGYEIDKFQVNAGYGYIFGEDTINNVDYELDMHNFMIGARYNF